MQGRSSAKALTIVYVAHSDDNEVRVYHLDDDGAMELIQIAPYPDVSGHGNSSPMVLARASGRLYVGFRAPPRKAVCYAISPTDGRLTHIGNTVLAANPAYLSLDPTERTLFSTSFAEGKVAVNPIDENGLVEPATQCLECGLKSHAARLAPDGKTVIVAALGVDRIRTFDWNAQDRRLSENFQELFESNPNSGPRHLIFNKAGDLIYVLNQTNASVDVFLLRGGASRGPVQSMTLLPEGFEGKPLAADICMTPDGRFVYASERGTNTISGFAVDAETGLLDFIGRWAGESEPRAIAISPAGRFLAVAGTLSAHVLLYEIAKSGELMRKGRTACGNGPNWIEMTALPAA